MNLDPASPSAANAVESDVRAPSLIAQVESVPGGRGNSGSSRSIHESRDLSGAHGRDSHPHSRGFLNRIVPFEIEPRDLFKSLFQSHGTSRLLAQEILDPLELCHQVLGYAELQLQPRLAHVERALVDVGFRIRSRTSFSRPALDSVRAFASQSSWSSRVMTDVIFLALLTVSAPV